MDNELALPHSRVAWGGPDFAVTLKAELAAQAEALPLQAALRHTSTALPETLEVMLISAEEREGCVAIRLGLFFAGMTGGCSCADDPTPVEPEAEYAELALRLDLSTGKAVAALLEA